MLVSDWLTHWLTDQLTDSRLVNLIDMTLACEDAYSKLVEVVTVADVVVRIMLATACYRFGSWSLVLKLNFFQTSSTRSGQDFEVEVQTRFWSWSLASILLLIFLWRLWSWILVEILKPGLVNILNFKFTWDADVCWCRDFEVGTWSIFWRWNLINFFYNIYM